VESIRKKKQKQGTKPGVTLKGSNRQLCIALAVLYYVVLGEIALTQVLLQGKKER
jgi:hypothetical protein